MKTFHTSCKWGQVLAAITIVSGPAWAQNGLVVVDNTTPIIPIVTVALPPATKPALVPAKGTPPSDPVWRQFQTEKRAFDEYQATVWEIRQTDELARYLKLITGQEPKRQRRTDTMPPSAIVVGAACPPALQAEAQKLGPDGFIIKTEGRYLYICGGGRKGTIYGVYGFLEDVLGCRWWAWDAEFVPSRPEIKLAQLNLKSASPFLMHDLYNQEAQTTRNNMVFKVRSKATFQPTGNHTFYNLLAPYAAKKPEYWPYHETKDRASGAITFKGRRVATSAADFNSYVNHFNYLAPGMAEDLAEALEGELVKRGGNLEDWLYFAGQGDWFGGLDLMPESLKVYEEEAWTDPDGVRRTASSAPMVRLLNKTGEILAKKFPGINVGTFAYMSTDSPPANTKPGSNVYIWLPRLRYGITLGIEEAAGENKHLAAVADLSAGAQQVPTLGTEAQVTEPTKPAHKLSKEILERMAQREADLAQKRADAKADLNIRMLAGSRKIKHSIEKWAQVSPGRLLIWDYGTNYVNYLLPTPNLRAMAQNIKYYHRIGVRGVMIQGNYSSMGGDLAVLKNYVWRKLLWDPTLDTEALILEFCRGYYGPAATEVLDYVNLLENSTRVPDKIIADEFNATAPYLTPQVVTQLRAALDRATQKVQGEANAAYLLRVQEVAASLEARELWVQGTLAEKDGKLWRTDQNAKAGGAYTYDRARILAKAARGSGVSELSNAVLQTRRMLSWNGGPLHTLTAGSTTAKIAPNQGIQRLWQLLTHGKVAMEASSVTPGSDLFEVTGTPTATSIGLQGETGYGSWDPTPDQLQNETISLNAEGVLQWTGSIVRTHKVDGATAAPRFESKYTVLDAKKLLVEYNDGTGWKQVEFGTFTGRFRPMRKEELGGAPQEKYIVELPQPVEKLQVRVTRDDTKTQILDTIIAPRSVAVAAVWVPRERAVKTYVWCEKLSGYEVGLEAPAFQRTIAARPFPAP